MKTFRKASNWLVGAVCGAGLGALPASLAQLPAPRIGYVYPAGGRQGASIQVVVGGQYLEQATNVYVSGGGVRAEWLDYRRPMPPGQFNLLRERLRELEQKRAAALRSVGARRRGAGASTNVWTEADEKMLADIRARILKNPPNRNATPAIAETVTFRFSLAPDAAPGERELRLGAPNGLSNPLRFCIGQLPEVSAAPAQAPNPDLERLREGLRRRLGQSQEPRPKPGPITVSLPATLNGQIMPGEVDRFRFAARNGQHLVAAVSARALIPYLADAVPGWFQATLALYDAEGRELAYADDFRFHPDPVLHCEIPKDGDYVLEIKDAIFRGREDFVYRITVGELPFLTGIFPLGGRAGTQTRVELQGWNLPQTTLTHQAPDQASGLTWLFVRHVDPASTPGRRSERESNRLPFAVDPLPELLEQEPNDQPENAQRLALPVIVNGRVNPPGDTDLFRFEGRAGDLLVAEVLARRLESPLDSALQLTDAQGRLLAANDDYEDKGSGLNTHHADSYLRFSLPADGTYFLRLADTQRQGGAELAYRLRLSPPQPDFDLRVVPSSLTLRPGASAPLTVYALRKDGFAGEISLALKDPPAGFLLSGARLPANQQSIRLTLTAQPTLAGAPVPLILEGRATIQGRQVTRPAVPAEDMMQAFAYRHLVPAQELMVAVAGRPAGRGPLRLLGSTPVRLPAGGTARLRIGLPMAALADQIQFELDEPPEGLWLKNVVRSGWTADLEFASDAAKAPAGLEGNLIVKAFASRPAAPAKAKAQANRQRVPVGTLPAIPFEIVAP